MPAGPIAYPYIEDVLNLARIYVNDAFAGATATAGEGRIFVDTWPPILTVLNAAIQAYQRELANAGVPTNTKEIFINLVPPVNSSLGIGAPNPAIQQFMSYFGFWDGALMGAVPILPTDLLVPLEIWQRSSGTGLTYSKLDKAADGLESMYQDFSLGQWEWRGDAIYWNGALVTKDIRLRYSSTVQFYPTTTPPATFATTQIPFVDSLEPLAYRTAYTFAQGRAPAGAVDDLMAGYKLALEHVINRYVRQKQRTVTEKQPYGESGNFTGWFH